jgi:hypothetical protein
MTTGTESRRRATRTEARRRPGDERRRTRDRGRRKKLRECGIRRGDGGAEQYARRQGEKSLLLLALRQREVQSE